MAQIISTNTASLIAQSNLNKSQATYTSAISQLSSGKKVSTAADNSAGLAISGRMQAQINGGTQAVANANDGIALAQTADSALSQITANLQSVRTLAVQAANSTYSASDRASLNQQAQQLLAQVNTIATQTQYNGQTLLDGTFGQATFQTGANAGQTSTVNLSQGVKISQIGQTASQTFSLASVATAGQAATAGNGLADATKSLSIAVGDGSSTTIGTAVEGSEAGQDADSAYAAALAINNANISGLTATASNVQTFELSNTSKAAADTVVNLTINGVNVYGDAGLSVAKDASVSTGDLVNQINSVSGDTGVTASLDKTGNLMLNATDGRNISISQSSSGGATGYTLMSTTLAGDGKDSQAINGYVSNTSAGFTDTSTATPTVTAGTTLQGTVSLSASSKITLTGTGDQNLNSINADGSTTAGTATATSSAVIGVNTQKTLANLSLTTADGATSAIQSIDSALSTISSLQGNVGAIQNRFDSTISNLNATVQNVTSAQSTITDADYSSVASTLSTADVLQQAGIAMVSKANQLPSQIMKLLQ